MNFPAIGLCHALKFFEYHFSTKFSILDAFPEIGMCHAQNYIFDDWMRFPEIGQAHAPEICQ